jgi:hypothetical protein
MVAAGLQRSSKPPGISGGGNTGLDNGQPVRSRRRDRGRGKKKMVERRDDVVQSWHKLGWGPTVRRINLDGGNSENILVYLPCKLEIATTRI